MNKRTDLQTWHSRNGYHFIKINDDLNDTDIIDLKAPGETNIDLNHMLVASTVKAKVYENVEIMEKL
jgi:hypothetical protein